MSDVDAVTRAQSGDPAAFRELFQLHRGDVMRLVTRMLGPCADVEDVVQDVFVHVFRSLHRFRGDSKFTTWLYRLTVNVTRMHLRKGRSRPKVVDLPVPERSETEMLDAPDVGTDRRRAARVLEQLVSGLSEKKRAVLVLHDFEGISPKEIAEIVEAPVMTVRTRLFYARRELYAAIAADPRLGPIVQNALSEPKSASTEDTSVSGARSIGTAGSDSTLAHTSNPAGKGNLAGKGSTLALTSSSAGKGVAE